LFNTTALLAMSYVKQTQLSAKCDYISGYRRHAYMRDATK